jgi:hypothetical protein
MHQSLPALDQHAERGITVSGQRCHPSVGAQVEIEVKFDSGSS